MTVTAITTGAAGLSADSTAAGAFGGSAYATRDKESWMEGNVWSVEAIIRPTTTVGYHCVYSFDSSGSRGWSIYLKDAQMILFRGFDDALAVTPTDSIVANTTYHLVVTSNAGTIKFYLNGAQSGADQTLLLSEGLDRTTGHVIGASYAGTGTPVLGFEGTIDEVAFFPTILSPARVLVHAQAAGLA